MPRTKTIITPRRSAGMLTITLNWEKAQSIIQMLNAAAGQEFKALLFEAIGNIITKQEEK